MKDRTQKVAYFAGLSAFIGMIENYIPLPIPFLRLGLSNIPVCFAFTKFNFFECAYIILFKAIFSHLFRGTLFSHLFLIALSGNILFLLIGFPFYYLFKKHISFVALSVIGAFAHNIGQVLVAVIFIPPKPLYYIGLLLLSIGTILGFVNGIICNILNNRIFVRFFND